MFFLKSQEKIIKTLSQYTLILFVSLFLMLFDNLTFFTLTMKVYPPNMENSAFLLSLFFLLAALTVFLLALLGSRYMTKPLVILVLLVSALTAYFMDSYHVVIDTHMIRNALQTNINESLDLLNLKLVGYFLFLGVLPSYLVYRTPIVYRGIKRELLAKILTLLLSALLMAGLMFLFSKHYTSFIREHKPLRYTANPSYWIYSGIKYLKKNYFTPAIILQPVGRDAKIMKHSKPKLVIMVVGEATRADHWGLNGYSRKTTPRLRALGVANFPALSACGTATARSVPCMFSRFGRTDFDYRKGIGYENVLDILKHTGKVSLLWRDNNSDSKGVALRIPYEDYKTAAYNSICEENGECRDEGMLIGLDKYIADQNGNDILIVLHQMGNHGPAYYKRYPKAYAQFTPACLTNQLEECTQQEIINAYDNAILHTDAFLSDTVALLHKYTGQYDTGMIYMADHGESLGENGVYLHGMPYFMAPEAQKHVAAVMWFGDPSRLAAVRGRAKASYSHDNLFHTLLGLFAVETKEYIPNMDILHDTQ